MAAISAWYNVGLRSYLAGEFQLCSSIYECMRLSLRAETGPDSLLECLRLLQVLTYDSAVLLGPSWTNDLVAFLVKEVM